MTEFTANNDPCGSPLPDDLAGFLLNHTACAVRRLTEDALEPLAITTRHFAILATLSHKGPLSQHAIGAALRIDRTTVVHLVDELEARRALVRNVDPGDRRAHALALTTTGRTLLRKAGKLVRSAEEQFLAPLGGRERELLQKMLTRLLQMAPGVARSNPS